MNTRRRVKANIKRKREPREKGGGLPDQEVLKKENEKNINLLRRGLKTGTTQAALEEDFARQAGFTLVQISIETMTICCPVTKA